ncbi:hypothetical protein ACLB2K_037106 [Fragaria x ananassa]
MSPHFNCTYMALIPKVDNPEVASQFRHIALCNFGYKILTKIISNRLKLFMSDLITENQSAFVSGRQIQDNILVVHEYFHRLKMLRTGTNGELALKLDMNKAYDRVDWHFLEKVLLKMGFQLSWVRIVMDCVSSVSMALIINGSLGKRFQPSRGLHQGDPLSPFLFLFINGVLSSMINKMCDQNVLDAVRITENGPLVSHFFFADDSLFFLKASLYNCETLSDTFHLYCTTSGQSINVNKSSLYFSPNTRQEIVHLLSLVLNMKAVDDPGMYLGLPTVWGRSKVAALKYVKEKINKRIVGWNSSSLTQAGKEIMIKAVAFTVPAYPMMVFKFPNSLCNQISSSLSKFWWGNSHSSGVH